MSVKDTVKNGIIYRNITHVPEYLIRYFLDNLTVELETWGELYIDKRSGKRYLHKTVNGYVAIIERLEYINQSCVNPKDIIGLGYIYKLWNQCELEGFAVANVSIVVKKKYQGCGVGQMFHILLEQLAKSQRIGKFYASQNFNNDIALHLVKKRGWTVRKVKDKYIVEKLL